MEQKEWEEMIFNAEITKKNNFLKNQWNKRKKKQKWILFDILNGWFSSFSISIKEFSKLQNLNFVLFSFFKWLIMKILQEL